MFHHVIPNPALSPAQYLADTKPEGPVHFHARGALRAKLDQFLTGFPGLVTYAVKANPADAVLTQLWAGGIGGFDVASPAEIALVRRLCPGAALHYNNPVRSRAEISCGIAAGVCSWSVDDAGEFAKLVAQDVPLTSEVAVRFRLPIGGAQYNFGAKFGADPEQAVALLQAVAAAGFRPALTFHVGTQCADPAAWGAYVTAAAGIAARAGVTIDRLNVGGGFPSARDGRPVDLSPFFAAIKGALSAFPHAPALVCEPGRGLVADTFAYAVPVKSVRENRVYLADGIYGGLSEFPSMPMPVLQIIAASPRRGAMRGCIVFGPTCDSLDRLPGEVPLPDDLQEGDWLLWSSMGAYLTGVTTRFNGYGEWETVIVDRL
jgi:ornithine decarboxylase